MDRPLNSRRTVLVDSDAVQSRALALRLEARALVSQSRALRSRAHDEVRQSRALNARLDTERIMADRVAPTEVGG